MASVIDVLRLLQLIFFFYISIVAAIFRKSISFFPNPNRFLSFAKLGDLALSLYFYHCGLSPCTVDLDDQTTVHFWIPKHRRIKRPSLLLIHGFGGNSKWQFYRQVGSLHRNFNLFVPDLVFFGGSYSKGSDRTDVFQARCIGEGMKRLGVNQFSVFGISYGGYVAYRMADIYREEVEKLVIMSCGICFTEEQMAEEMKKVGRDIVEILVPEKPEDLRVLVNRAMYRPSLWFPAFLLQDFINVMYKNHRREKMEMLHHLMHGKSNSDPPPVLNQETLILWGDKDNFFPLFLAHQLSRHLGEKSKVEIIKDAGHAANLESPNLVNRLIKSFILDS
ncbi:Alpha/beta hydrolase fold-1 [Macleaya cordata]|uniref:Alpha/beta hydrolase fold-1 n=1 Tax=Macleaya cordata TaxID=56857 RepID=A0A200QIX1_MACCD|nr:Alpha/beta hydrolase fold-1 [Macleaya cordata]